MDSEDLELLNGLFDGLKPEEQERFVIRALDQLGIEIPDLAELKHWKVIYRAVRELGLVRDGDRERVEALRRERMSQ